MAKELEADWEAGRTLYAKPSPRVTDPWATGVVALTEDGDQAGHYYADVASPANNYAVFEQAGVSPASTDTVIGYIRDPLGRRERHRQIAADSDSKRTDVIIEAVP